MTGSVVSMGGGVAASVDTRIAAGAYGVIVVGDVVAVG